MASRRKKNRLKSQLDGERPPSPVRLSRKDAAHRQLTHAIELFFSGGDDIVIHVLASTSLNICRPVAKAAGHKLIAESIEDAVRDEYREYWRTMLNEPYNFFKHGGAAPLEELRYFNPEFNEILIWEACHEYAAAFKKHEMEMIVFLCWRLNEGRRALHAYEQGPLQESSAAIFASRETPSTRRHALTLLEQIATDRVQRERSRFVIPRYDTRS